MDYNKHDYDINDPIEARLVLDRERLQRQLYALIGLCWDL